jgi:hypothetical protein
LVCLDGGFGGLPHLGKLSYPKRLTGSLFGTSCGEV